MWVLRITRLHFFSRMFPPSCYQREKGTFYPLSGLLMLISLRSDILRVSVVVQLRPGFHELPGYLEIQFIETSSVILSLAGSHQGVCTYNDLCDSDCGNGMD